MYISEDPPEPNFAFTIGLFVNHDHPEVVVADVDREGAGWLLTRISEQVRDGRRFDAVHEFDDVLQNRYKLRFREVSTKLRDEHLGTAKWFYGGTDFPALQAFVPDVNGKYPWEQGFHGNASAQFLKGDNLRKRKALRS
jgi:hypothetical protein